jgi:hypothetical protein
MVGSRQGLVEREMLSMMAAPRSRRRDGNPMPSV